MPIKINGTNTAANPSITGDDTDTGIVYGSDQIDLSTGGSSKVTLNGSNLGIGLASPTAKLHINGTTNGLQARFGGTGTGLGILCGQKTNNNALVTFEAQDSTYGTITFKTAGGERMRILSGGGITFNGDTAADNALDDYEEGTWTPTFDGNTASNTANNCFYVKVGRLVTIFFRATMASSSSSSYANIANLPFNSVNSTDNIAGGAFSDSNAGENLHLGVVKNANYAYIIEIGASSTITRTQSSLSGKDFRGSITYMTT